MLKKTVEYLHKGCVLWMVVVAHRFIRSPVVCNEEGPAPPVTAVLVTPVQDVAVEEKGITGLQLHMD